MDIGVLTGKEQTGEMRSVAQRDGNLGLLAEQIDILVEGADLKCPGNDRILLHCIGNHCRYKNREEYHQDQNAQCLHP